MYYLDLEEITYELLAQVIYASHGHVTITGYLPTKKASFEDILEIVDRATKRFSCVYDTYKNDHFAEIKIYI